MLVISETLQHGAKSGIKVALSPIITDLPIILLTLVIVVKLTNFHSVLGIVSLFGGLFILFTGYESIRTQAVEVTVIKEQQRSLSKGILTNLLSPYPYLFWISVGAPTMTKALNINLAALVAFIGSFYLALVGSKIILAMAVGKSRQFLSGKVYLYTQRFLGILLCAFAVVLFKEGLKLLGLI